MAAHIDLESGENYLETILILKHTQSSVRGVDIANKLNVSRASVSRAVSILKERAFITLEKGNFILLTEEGKKIAQKIFNYHRVLASFLIYVAGITPKVADVDACRIEHVVSASTITAIQKFLKQNNVPITDYDVEASHVPDIKDLNESAENYLEHIHMETRDGRSIRASDLSKALDVTRASVSKALDNLEELGLLERGEKGALILTEAGLKKAEGIYQRHIVLTGFFEKIIGVSAKIAEKDACRIEHMISEETFQGIKTYLEKA